MLTVEERALVTHMADRLIELYVERDRASGDRDSGRLEELQAEIDEVAAQRREILDHQDG